MRFVVLIALGLLALPAPADAQGKGRPKRPAPATAPGNATASSSVAGTAGSAVAPAFRQFGVWLDDASSPAAGHGRAGIGAGYWRFAGGSLIDVPIVDVAFGVTDRFQLAATVPFYRSTYEGATSRGVDDVYLSGKFLAIDPAVNGGGFGLAVTPVIEILSPGFTDDRVHWALPVSVELRAAPFRVYGATGYFSRGAVFGSGALEWTSPSGTMLTGALTHSVSTTGDTAGMSASRSDINVTIAQALTDAVSAYVGLGRSLTPAEDGGTTIGISGGLSFSFGTATSTP